MHQFSVGSTRVHHVTEWEGPFASPAELFAGFDAERFATFRNALPGDMYLADSDEVYAFPQSQVLVRDGGGFRPRYGAH